MSGSDSKGDNECALSDESDGSKWYKSKLDDPWLIGVSARWLQGWQRKSRGEHWRTGAPCETPVGTPRCTPRDNPCQSTPRISSRINTPRTMNTPRTINTPRGGGVPGSEPQVTQVIHDARACGIAGARAKVFGTPNGGQRGWLNRTICLNESELALGSVCVNVSSGDFNFAAEQHWLDIMQ